MGCGEIMLAGRREREDGRPGNRLRGVRTGQSGHRLHPDHCLSPTYYILHRSLAFLVTAVERREDITILLLDRFDIVRAFGDMILESCELWAVSV